MKIAEAYENFILTKKRYCFLYGGAGSGKSEHAGRKIIIRALQGGRHLIVRKYASTLNNSVIHLIEKILKSENLPYKFTEHKRQIKVAAGEIIFTGLDDEEKIKSIDNISSVWCEEASEITPADFNQLDLRLRGETGFYKQFILTFNPVARAEWLKDKMEELKQDDVFILKTTYKDNPFLDKEYIKTLQGIKDKNYYNVYTLGEWGEKDNTLVYKDYKIFDFDVSPDFYGLDFGFNNPTALVGIKREGNKYFVKEMLYRSNLTNQELISLLKQYDLKDRIIYCDSAEPNRIEELRRAGFNARASIKDVNEGIAYLRQIELFVAGENLLKEISQYAYKIDRNGRILEEVLKVNDHLLDAMRYAIYTNFVENSGRLDEKTIATLRWVNEFI